MSTTVNISERSVQGQLLHYVLFTLQHRFALLNNVGIYGWEADVVSLTKSNRVHEWEIKVSRGDLLADLKKRKHYFISENIKGPNYFSYVGPEEIFRKDDQLPPYAGVVKFRIGKYGNYLVFENAKRPALLHDRPLREKEVGKVARYLSFTLSKLIRDQYPLISENGSHVEEPS